MLKIPNENEPNIDYGIRVLSKKLKKFNINNLAIDSIQEYEMLKDSLLVLDELCRKSEMPCKADMYTSKVELKLIRVMLLSNVDNLKYNYKINKELLK